MLPELVSKSHHRNGVLSQAQPFGGLSDTMEAYEATNPAQHLEAYFGSAQVLLQPSTANDAPAWTTTLTLLGYRYGPRMFGAHPGSMVVRGNRIEIEHPVTLAYRDELSIRSLAALPPAVREGSAFSGRAPSPSSRGYAAVTDGAGTEPRLRRLLQKGAGIDALGSLRFSSNVERRRSRKTEERDPLPRRQSLPAVQAA